MITVPIIHKMNMNEIETFFETGAFKTFEQVEAALTRVFTLQNEIATNPSHPFFDALKSKT